MLLLVYYIEERVPTFEGTLHSSTIHCIIVLYYSVTHKTIKQINTMHVLTLFYYIRGFAFIVYISSRFDRPSDLVCCPSAAMLQVPLNKLCGRRVHHARTQLYRPFYVRQLC